MIRLDGELSAPFQGARAAVFFKALRKLQREFPSEGVHRKETEPLALAVSGGMDSMVMLHLFAAWARKSGPQIHVLHVDHMTRSVESSRAAHLVAETAAKWDVPCSILSIDGAGKSETQLKVARETTLCDAALTLKLRHIAKAHHLEDRVESIFMALLRGTGWLRASADTPGRQGVAWCRPLQRFSRQEVKDVAEAMGVFWAEDSTNLGTGPRRNHLRNVVFPMLRTKHNRAFDAHLLNWWEELGAVEAFVDAQAKACLENAQCADFGESGAAFAVSDLLEAPFVLRKWMFRHLLATFLGSSHAWTRANVQGMNDLITTTRKHRRLELPGSWIWEKKDSRVQFVHLDFDPETISGKDDDCHGQGK